MGLVRRICLLGVGFAGLVAAALPAFAVEATLVADAHVNSARPGVNSGTISNLNVGGGYTALLQFDLSMLPAGTTAAQVSRATLRLYCNRMDTAGQVSLQPVSGSWGEYSVTYETLPSLGSAAQVVSVGQAGAYVMFDVTALVQGWVGASATNNGVALTAGTAMVQFDSKENDLTGHAAVLDLTLASMGAQGPSGSAGATGATGATGPVGPTGATGPQGLQGAAGTPGLSFQGAYADSSTYALNDVVTFSGSSFVSLAEGNRGNTPGSTPQWAVLAQGGGVGSGAGIVYRGAYGLATTYAVNDVVTYQGSSYVSLISANYGNTPGVSPGQWGVLAVGAVGTQGPAGATGAQGPQGLIGPTGVAGPKGTAGVPGPPGLVYQGNYSPSSTYALGDVVLWQGVSFTSLSGENRGSTPSASPGQWGVLTAQGPVGATGAQGPQGTPGQAGMIGPVGPAGAAGANGAAGPQGPPVSFVGEWLAGTNYSVGSVVGFGGSSYVSLTANVGRQPDMSSMYWGVLARAGSQGPAGAVGATGVQGPTGFAGPQGESGPMGSQGPAGPIGLAGAPGLAGPQGVPGAAGEAGPAGLVYRGTYSSSTNYGLNDAVSYQGSSYISVAVSNIGNTPNGSPTMWSLLAVQGAAGAKGDAGATGSQGAPGIQGPQGVAGIAGPSGAVGVTYRGQWGIAANYHANDIVSFGGSTYLAGVGSIGSEPDAFPSVWALLARDGSAGATGPTGPGATVDVGTVTTGAAGTRVTVTNSGTPTAAVLNFTIPRGEAGANGTGGSGGGVEASGIPFASIYHSVSFNLLYYSVNSSTDTATETDPVLTWVPAECTATQLSVFSRQTNTVNVTLRQGTPGSMANTSLVCSVAPGGSCSQTGNVAIAAGNFVDFTVTGASGTASPMWMALACN